MKEKIQNIINLLDEFKDIINLDDEKALLKKLNAYERECQNWLKDDSVYTVGKLEELKEGIRKIKLEIRKIELIRSIQKELKELT